MQLETTRTFNGQPRLWAGQVALLEATVIGGLALLSRQLGFAHRLPISWLVLVTGGVVWIVGSATLLFLQSALAAGATLLLAAGWAAPGLRSGPSALSGTGVFWGTAGDTGEDNRHGDDQAPSPLAAPSPPPAVPSPAASASSRDRPAQAAELRALAHNE